MGSSSALGLQFILMIIRKTAPNVLFAASGTLQSRVGVSARFSEKTGADEVPAKEKPEPYVPDRYCMLLVPLKHAKFL